MQRQKKQLLIMVVLLVIGIFAYIGIHFYNQKQEEQEAAENEAAVITITDFLEDDITEFSYSYDGELLEFVREDGAWYYKTNRGLSIDSNQIDSMLSQVAGLVAKTEVTDYESLADYGLDSPVNTLSLHVGGDTVELLLGDENEILGQYYVKRADEDKVYLISISLDTVFAKSVSDLEKEEESTDTESSE